MAQSSANVSVESIAARLSDTLLDLKTRVAVAVDIRDSVEVFQSSDYPRFLSTIIPTFSNILRNSHPVLYSGLLEQKLRNTIFEIIHRLPQNEALKLYIQDLTSLLLESLRIENEDNATYCMKTLVDLHKNYRSELDGLVKPFVDIVMEMYTNMEQAVKESFDTPLSSVPQGSINSPAPSPASESSEPNKTPTDDSSKALAKGLYSFKVLAECPITIVTLLQAHQQENISANISILVPIIIKVLSLQAKAQKEAHEIAKSKGELFIGVSPQIRNRNTYAEFIHLQVKTLSFLAYILKGWTGAIRPYQMLIPEFVARLLCDCPAEGTSTRKELLVATRHILSTDFRTAFIGKIDILLNEQVLLGTGLTSYETLRVLAFSMLADLVHHVRLELTSKQLSRVVHIFSRAIHDPMLAVNIQTMCAKLLLNLVECISSNMVEGGEVYRRSLLLKILDAFVNKFESLNLNFTAALKQYRKRKQEDETKVDNEKIEDVNLDSLRPINAAVVPDNYQDNVKDMRAQFKHLIPGLKVIVSSLRNIPLPTLPEGDHGLDSDLTCDEVGLFVRLFREGFKCFDYYIIDYFQPDGSNPDWQNELLETIVARLGNVSSKEERDTLDQFASVFVLLEPSLFQEIFTSQIGFLIDRITVNPPVSTLPQAFLANETVSYSFAGIMLRYLVDNMEMVGSENRLRGSTMVRMFKFVFMAISLYPDQIEVVLQHHIGNIILTSMKLSMTAKDPLNYFYLLRALFRSIGGGRFELLYKEVLPLLQVLLERMNALLDIPHKPEVRELFVELCLTVPVRLSILLPYLSYLMKPLVIAIRSNPELVGQGLRTLELCIDNLTQEFLDPIVAPVIHELMDSLYRHLKPLPYNHTHAHTTLRILGKLGGRNRRLLKDAPILNYCDDSKGLDMRIDFITHSSFGDGQPTTSSRNENVFELDEALSTIKTVLMDRKYGHFYKEHAFSLIKSFLALVICTDDVNEKSAEIIANNIQVRLSSQSSENDQQNAIDDMELDPTPTIYLPESGIFSEFVSQSSKSTKESVLTKLISSLFIASTIPELKERAWSFLENLCHHFALLMVSETLNMMDSLLKQKKDASHQSIIQTSINNSDSLCINSFLNSIVDTMTSDDFMFRNPGEQGLIKFYNSCQILLQSKDSIGQLPVFHSLIRKFCSSCYKEEWYRKSGGCLGISVLCCKLDLGTKWMMDHELELIRALLYVLKDTPPEIANNNVEDATQALSHVLKVCNRPDNEDEGDRQAKFNSLISLLITELSNANNAVRETIQLSFQLLADLTGSEVTELLLPVRERLLAPIFTKPLRALPFAMQIGHIDAITYCLSLRPPLLTFNDDLLRLLHEALALADADDQALVSRTSQYKNASSLNNLRVVCIKLLSSAMACNDFLGPKQSHTRARIISVFFKSLYSKSPEVIEVANKGLKQVLAQQHKLPRDLLQAGLRPILMNLSNHKQLTVPGLEGLGRLLSLLTNYFKVEVGRKLLDHLSAWAEPQVLQENACKPLSEVHEVKIIVAVLGVFHLLPPAASLFLDELVQTTLHLEKELRRSFSSPFRKPLLMFLNRYPKETMDYFFGKILNQEYMNFFIAIVGMDSANVLREQLMSNPDTFLQHTFQAEQRKPSQAYNGIMLLKQISKYSPDWISSNQQILQGLINYWTSDEFTKRVKQEEFLGISRIRESACMIEILTKCCFKEGNEPEILFKVASIFCQDTVMPHTFFTKFLHDEIALKYSGAHKRKLLEYFLTQFENPEVSKDLKVQHLRLIINPVLIVAFSRPEEHPLVIDRESINLIHAKIWHQINLAPLNDQTSASDSLTVELLQLTSLILEYASHLASDIRKDIIKFGWNYLKHDDMIVRQSANVLIAKFIAAYDTPPKIIIQIYIALLRAHQPEARALVKQALDILTPVLPKRIANVTDTKFPTWLRWIRRIIVEDGHNIIQLVNIYQLMVRHPELFYPHREHFFPHICNSLSKLAFNSNSTTETRLLTFDLAELLLKWERQRTSAMDDSDSQYVPALPIRETVVNYLVRFICSTSESIQKRGSAHRALELVKAFLSPEIWAEVPINLSNFERSMVQNELVEANFNSITNSLQVLHSCIKNKPSEWFINNISALHKLLEKCLRSEDIVISRNLTPLLGKIYESVNETLALEKPPQEVMTFTTMVEGIIQDGLQNMTNLYSIMMILNSSCAARPENLDQFISLVARLSQKLTKDHITPPPNSTPQSILIARDLLIISLKLLKSRIAHLTDQRRWFLTSLIQLIEKSTDEDLCRSLLEMISDWVLKKSDAALPTIKEKANLLVKMMCFENLPDKSLIEEYLKLVADIYQNPSFSRSELTVKLQNAFLLGSKYPNPDIRNRFANIFDNSMSRSLFTRLAYVFGQQSWEYFGETPWLQQALDILLGSIHDSNRLHLSANSPRIVAIGDLLKSQSKDASNPSSMEVSSSESEKMNSLLHSHMKFLMDLHSLTVRDVITPLRQLLHISVDLTFKLWLRIFPLFWNNISRRERGDLVKILISFLAKDYHTKQATSRPNVIETLLQGIARCTPAIRLPPHVLKYLGKTFNSWHIVIELLESASGSLISGDIPMSKEEIRRIDSSLDDLGEFYTILREDDMFYGLCKRRSLFTDTVTSINLEQHGLWYEAQLSYENAQKQARNGTISFSESEYRLWEEHWILCTQKLQQFDCLLELGKHDNNNEMQLESAWRIWDWNSEVNVVEKMLQTIPFSSSPRLKFFESFLLLISPESPEKSKDFLRKCDEGIQLLLQEWNSLPTVVTNSHIHSLHTFQLHVELQEANQIFNSLASTKANNLDSRSQDIKGILQTWRERLPNIWDDIHIWSDIISWRQHIFNAINKAYLPLIPQISTTNTNTAENNANASTASSNNSMVANSSSNTYSNAYRGYHETAWLINRFAHVARKHRLIDVCVTNLAKIYTLPNIEIQEAFLKLREQAKSHYQRGEYSHALDVINNTNMSYFTPIQKAEFYILKGRFLSQMDLHDDSNQSYSSAIQMDLHIGKAWGAWGEYNDLMFKHNKSETSWGVSAINCYLHASGIYKSNRSRKFIARILWLLSIDDENGVLSQSFDAYKGEMPVWYWITFIPQLISSLPLKDNKIARFILMKIAKSYPQALHYQLRTAKEECALYYPDSMHVDNETETTADEIETKEPSLQSVSLTQSSAANTPVSFTGTKSLADHIDDINGLLKTAYPLLALSIETMIDQISKHLIPSQLEDLYYQCSIILAEYSKDLSSSILQSQEPPPVPENLEERLKDLCCTLNLEEKHQEILNRLLKPPCNLQVFVERLIEFCRAIRKTLLSWADTIHLEHNSHYLVEFKHQKFDDVEVPGQYLKLKDNSNDFVRIERFLPDVRLQCYKGSFSRRITIRGHNGVQYPFNVETRITRSVRREERFSQLFRILNKVLGKNIESRKRSISYTLPLIIPLSPQIRLVEDNISYQSLSAIFGKHLDNLGLDIFEPLKVYLQKLTAASQSIPNMSEEDKLNAKLQTFEDISSAFATNVILKKSMVQTLPSSISYWLFRKEFAMQLACCCFVSYIMSMGDRSPDKFIVARDSGRIWLRHFYPDMDENGKYGHNEVVPFRLSPAMHTFIDSVCMEGILAPYLRIIADAFMTQKDSLNDFIGIFINDDITSWMTSSLLKEKKECREIVENNMEAILSKTKILSNNEVTDWKEIHPVYDLIAKASNPQNLAQMDVHWMPYF